MKKYRLLNLFLIILTFFIFSSCEEYLDKSEKADISDDEVFTDFISFQGFVESIYCNIVSLNSSGEKGTYAWNWGGDMYGGKAIIRFQSGDYVKLYSDRMQFWGGNQLDFDCTRGFSVNRVFFWQNGWAGIRRANLALAFLNRMVDATDEQRDLIEG